MSSPFGNPSSSGTGQGLFGQQSGDTGNGTSNNSQQPINIFGNNAQKNQSTNTSSLFGGSTSSNHFGSAPNTQGQTAGSTSLFSSPAPFGTSTGGSGSTGYGFGNSAEKNTENNGSSNALWTPNKPEPTQKQSTILFGNTPSQQAPTSQSGAATPTTSKPGFNFANASTTPAGPPPTNMFASLGQNQKSSSSALFGSGQTTPQNTTQSTDPSAAKPPPSLFGNQSQPSSSTPGNSDALFGSVASKPTPSLFGKPAESNALQTAKEAPKFSFGNAASPAQQQPSNSNSTEQPRAGAQFASKPSLGFPALSTSNAQSSGQATPISAGQDKTSFFGNANTPSNLFGQANQSKEAQGSTAPSVPALFANTNQFKDADSQSKQSSSPFNLGQNNTSGEQSQQPLGLFAGFGQNKGKDDSTAQSREATTSASATSGPTTTAPAATSTLFGTVGKVSQDNTSKAADKPAQTAGASTTLGASTAGPAPTPQSRLKNKSMDEIITRWASDLSKYQKEFQAQAEKVASWDRMLLENSNAISKLYSKAHQAERDTAEVQKQLSLVESHQDELSQWLDRYEREVDELMARQVGQGEGLQGPDQERERTYKIAERVSERLDEMGKDLTNMIEEINDASATISKTSKPDDPLSQIVRVLNGHLSQLQVIDQGAAELQAKISAAQREGQRLGSRNGIGASLGGGNDAVDHFYRSYMRRG